MAVPGTSAIGDFLILDAIRASKGTAVAVTDEEMVDAARALGAAEGLFPAPEGAACCVALSKLRRSGWVQAHESMVIFNTGAGLKYVECYAELQRVVVWPPE